MQSNLHYRSKSFSAAPKIVQRRQHKLIIRSPHAGNADNILQRARQLYHSQNNLEEAVKLFQQYLSVHPKHNQSLYLSAVAYLHLNNCQEAIVKLTQISQDFENKPNALLLTAMAHKRIGSTSLSLAIINDCLHKYEDFEEALCFRGKLYLTMNFVQKAQLDYKNATNLPDPSFPCFLGLGDCYRYGGKVQKALNAYQKSLELIGKSTHLNEDSHKAEIQLKIAICKYRLERYEQSYTILTELAKKHELKISQLYYYMGQCEIKLGQRQKGVFNLEYSLRLQTNMGIMQKAFKQLIQLHLEKHQYYEASNIASMQRKYQLGLEIWSKTVESFMLIIKNQYQKGVQQLYDICDTIKASQSTKAFKKIIKETTDNEIQFRKKISLKINNRLIVKRLLGSESPKHEFNKNSKRLNFFSTKSVTKASKIESNRIHLNPLTIKLPENCKFKTQHSPQSYESDKKIIISAFSTKEKQFLYPLILQFKAYGQFFLEKYVSCVQTYEQYDTFLKQVLGKESDVEYNRNLSEGLLIDGEMPDEALQKYSNCVNIYYNQYNTIPPEPILYKISLLLRMAIVRNNLKQDEQSEQDASYQEILESTMQIIKNYDLSIGQHYMLHYFKAIIFILMEKFEPAKESLNKTMLLANECSWKILFVKGVLEMQLGHYANAVKQFSAGLLIEIKPELYLARSVTFLLLSRTSNSFKTSPALKSLMKSIDLVDHISGKSTKRESEDQFNNLKDTCLQKCFDDLQNYIEHSDNQEDISLWVSKILFTTSSYDEASSALRKLNFQTEQVLQLLQCIQIYEGQFDKGGQVGLIIKSAFDGEFLSETEEKKLLESKIIKNYNSFVYGYLTSDYEKWLVIVQLYMKKDYKLLLRYIQRELLSCSDEQLQVLLRYDMAILYLLTGQEVKAANVIKTMTKYESIFKIKEWIDKVLNYQFMQDECLSQLITQIKLPYAKLLSSYLPYRCVELMKQDKKIKIFIRPCIPWPKFKEPDLKLKLSGLFIVEQLSSSRVPKCLEAPWLVRVNNMVQFTQKLDESISSDFELQKPTNQ